MTPTDKMEMQITEEQDGGVKVTLPDDLALELEDAQEKQPEEQHQDDSDDDEPARSGDDPEREAIREARREERKLKKQLHREKAKESNHLITALRKQNEAMAQRVAELEKKTSGAELARVDKAIDDAGVQVEYAKMKMREAVSSQDGDGVAQAEELLYESRRRLESLQNVKQQATKQLSQNQQNIQVPDQAVQRMAADWMEDNPWYDPHGANEESQIAQVVDKRLTAEGYDPSTQHYWDELTDRVKKYVPNISNRGYNSANVNSQRPKSVMTSSGRNSIATTKSNEIRISPDRIAAMKEAGLWDNPKTRQVAIQKYVEWDRVNKKRG